MISRDLTITVNNNTASLSEPVTVYRGDRGIVLNCKIMQYKFKFNRSSLENVINRSTGIVYARVLVHRPSATECFEVPMAAVDNDIVVITITKEWLDEEIEIGTYKLQIQLYGEDYENERITIPPVEFNVEDTLCNTPDNFNVFSDKVGVAVAGLLEINENGEQYNSDYANGVYNETKWGSGDIVTANALNKMEDAIDYSVDAIHQLDVQLDNHTHDEYLTEHQDISGKADITYVNEEIAELSNTKADISSVNETVDGINANIAEVKGNIQENANAISALQSKQEEDVTGINNKIANDIQTAINNLTETHNEDVTAINNKIANDIEVAINELTEQHNADVTEINNKITNDIQTAINELTEQHNTDINNINTKIDEIELIYYKPSVDNEGNLSWENNGELENPAPINLSDIVSEKLKSDETFNINLSDIVSEKLKSDETFNTTLDEYIGAKVEERILLVSSLPSSPKSGYIYIVE